MLLTRAAQQLPQYGSNPGVSVPALRGLWQALAASACHQDPHSVSPSAVVHLSMALVSLRCGGADEWRMLSERMAAPGATARLSTHSLVNLVAAFALGGPSACAGLGLGEFW